jgi:hypothetical protein
MKKHIASIKRLSRREIERKFANSEKLSHNDLSDILFKMKYNLTPDICSIIINNLDEENRTFITGCPLPHSFNDLRTQGNCRFKNSFHHEINWITISILSHPIEINLFITYEKEFETLFLLGDYKNALEVLEKIENEICTSHWSIEKRLLIAEHAPDIQSKSELTNLIRNNCESLIKINSSYQRTRFDYNLPTNKYDEIIEKYASKQKNQYLAKYFLFKLNYFNNPNISYPEIALFFESNLSIIDRYQIFIQIAISLICDLTPNKSYIDSLMPCIYSVNDLVKDYRLQNILIYSGFDNKKVIENELHTYYEIIESFYTDNFNACFNQAEKFLKSKPYQIEIVELFVKTSIILKKDCPQIIKNDSFINRIIVCLYNIFLKNEDYDLSILTLNKIAKSISSSIWGFHLINIINYEQSKKDDLYNFQIHRILSLQAISPDIHLFIKEEENFKNFKEHFKGYRSIQNLISRNNSFGSSNIIIDPHDGFFFNLLVIRSILFYTKFDVALDSINQIINSSHHSNLVCIPFANLEIIKIKIQALYNLKEYKATLELLCKSIISNNKFLLPLNDQDLLREILNSTDLNIQENICTPILARIYKEKTNEIWVAYDSFMYSRNYTYPSELFENSFFEKDFLKYFLKYVCIQDVYDSSPAYNNPDELDNERIKICNYLCKIDPGKKESYVKEISVIETNALIKQGLKEVDESKIFVDTMGIWREIEYDVKELFFRGKELLKLSKDEIEYLFEMSSSVLLLYHPNKDEEGTIIKFGYERDKQEEIINQPHFVNFKETFLLIRDRFITSNEFGLDSYISMRIRHGTLLGQIRSVFEKYQLITKKSATTDQYIENDYWLSKLGVIKTRSVISEKMNDFSDKIDTMSDKIKNSFLQIKTEDKTSNGLFDFKFDDKILIDLYEKKFYSIDSHKAFYDSAVDCLWQRTEDNLNIIREKFANEFANNVHDWLEKMISSIEKQKKFETIDTDEFLRDITACKTETTNTFEKIALWFRRSYSNSINEFEMSLVISICLSIVNKIHPQTPILSPNIIINCDCIFQGKYFAFFIDIMRNILDNVIVRSELIEPELSVKIDINKKGDLLEIKIENNVSESINLATMNQRIATIQYRVDNKENDILLKKEGGSGYIKINNIIKNVLKRRNYSLRLEQIKEDRIFMSFISFELDGLIK